MADENSNFFKTPLNFLFTRRIVDHEMGVRLTGRANKYAIGAFATDD